MWAGQAVVGHGSSLAEQPPSWASPRYPTVPHRSLAARDRMTFLSRHSSLMPSPTLHSATLGLGQSLAPA